MKNLTKKGITVVSEIDQKGNKPKSMSIFPLAGEHIGYVFMNGPSFF